MMGLPEYWVMLKKRRTVEEERPGERERKPINPTP